MTKDNNQERLYNSVIQIASIMEELRELFGPDAKTWRIKRADAGHIERVSDQIQLLLTHYIPKHEEPEMDAFFDAFGEIVDLVKEKEEL